MKYLLLLLLIASTNCFGQGYMALAEQHRKSYIEDFLNDKNSPLKKDDLQFLRFYDIDSTYKVTARVEVLPNPSTFLMPTFSGTSQQYVPYAKLKFILKGLPVVLTLYQSTALSKLPQYADYLFLPFTDDTNGVTTYGGGRYIDLSAKDIKNGTIAVDFNSAYNPYCAFSGGYSCPKPPDENHLAISIAAGEKLFGGDKKH